MSTAYYDSDEELVAHRTTSSLRVLPLRSMLPLLADLKLVSEYGDETTLGAVLREAEENGRAVMHSRGLW